MHATPMTPNKWLVPRDSGGVAMHASESMLKSS